MGSFLVRTWALLCCHAHQRSKCRVQSALVINRFLSTAGFISVIVGETACFHSKISLTTLGFKPAIWRLRSRGPDFRVVLTTTTPLPSCSANHSPATQNSLKVSHYYCLWWSLKTGRRREGVAAAGWRRKYKGWTTKSENVNWPLASRSDPPSSSTSFSPFSSGGGGSWGICVGNNQGNCWKYTGLGATVLSRILMKAASLKCQTERRHVAKVIIAHILLQLLGGKDRLPWEREFKATGSREFVLPDKKKWGVNCCCRSKKLIRSVRCAWNYSLVGGGGG